jgi:hypothetical protein
MISITSKTGPPYARSEHHIEDAMGPPQREGQCLLALLIEQRVKPEATDRCAGGYF